MSTDESAFRSGFPFGPYSSGLVTKAVLSPTSLGGTQIAQMGCHHHDVGGHEVKNVGGGLVDLAIGLVVTGELGAQNAVPRQSRVLRHVRHQGNVAVRERRDDESLLQPCQSSHCVRPWTQPMPRPIERVRFGLGEFLDAEVDEDPVERHPMQAIELGPGQLTRSDAVHARAVPGPPGVGKLRPVDCESLLLCQLLHFLRHGRSPVNDGAEGIKNERLDRWRRRARPTAALKHA